MVENQMRHSTFLLLFLMGCYSLQPVYEPPKWNDIDFALKTSHLPFVCVFGDLRPRHHTNLLFGRPTSQRDYILALMTLEQFALFVDIYARATFLTGIPNYKVLLGDIVKMVAKETSDRSEYIVWVCARLVGRTKNRSLCPLPDGGPFICEVFKMFGPSIVRLSRKESISIISQKYPWLKRLTIEQTPRTSEVAQFANSRIAVCLPFQPESPGPLIPANKKTLGRVRQVTIRFANRKFKYAFCISKGKQGSHQLLIIFPPLGVLYKFNKVPIRSISELKDMGLLAVYAPRLGFFWENPSWDDYEYVDPPNWVEMLPSFIHSTGEKETP